jgi:hypothetical protein
MIAPTQRPTDRCFTPLNFWKTHHASENALPKYYQQLRGGWLRALLHPQEDLPAKRAQIETRVAIRLV